MSSISSWNWIKATLLPCKWQLLLDFSSPLDHSVNDRIPKEPFSVQHMKVDNVIDVIMTYGTRTFLAKIQR